MTVRWWREPAGEMPADPAGQFHWLQVQWAIVDSWIESRKAQAAAATAAAAGSPAAADPDDDGQGAGLLGSPG